MCYIGNGWRAENTGYTTMWANPCPHCPPDQQIPYMAPPQICTCPTNIYIPAGSHIHVDCPVHGKMVLTGSSVTTSTVTIL